MVTKVQTKHLVSASKTDILGADFSTRTIQLADSRVCTLVHYDPASKAKKSSEKRKTAILYIHGYTDYFFQADLAKSLYTLGYEFYAVDLHGYGRSLRSNQSPNYCKNFEDYHPDIQATLDVMAQDGITKCIPLAHSTGGLTITSYLRLHAEQHSKEAEHKHPIEIIGLMFNSPFLAMILKPERERFILPIYRFLVKCFPFISIHTQTITPYTQSLHETMLGEWDYRLDWKPAAGFPLSFYWLKQVMDEQERCSKITLNIPTLLCRSNRSTYMAKKHEDCILGDAVLNVDNMELKVKQIYPNLSISLFDKGFHDLYLSPQPIRDQYVETLKTWLVENQL